MVRSALCVGVGRTAVAGSAPLVMSGAPALPREAGARMFQSQSG